VLASWRPLEDLKAGGIRRAVAGIDRYIGDNFGFRPQLIQSFNAFKYSLGASPARNVILAKNGYLMSAEGPDHWDVDDYRGFAEIDERMLENWRVALKQRQRWLASMGTEFLFVIPPVKERIYPEMLPGWLQPEGKSTRVGALIQHLAGSEIDVLYLRDALLAAKSADDDLFYRKDTHWNFMGAFYAARAILQHLGRTHPNIKVPSLEQYEKTFIGTRQNASGRMDQCVKLGIVDCVAEDYTMMPKGGWTARETISHTPSYTIYTYEKDDPSLLSLVLYTDSFGWAMRRFLAEHFRRMVLFNPWEVPINPWELTADPCFQFTIEPAASERPDILIYSRLERGVPAPTCNPPEVARFADRQREN
jgi:hypothetical protein